SHVLTQYFVKDPAPANNGWVMHVLVDGVNPRNPAAVQPFSYDVNFDAAGQLAVPALTARQTTIPPAAPGPLDAPPAGAENGTLFFDVGDWTPAEKNAAGGMVANGADNAAISFDMRG